MKDALPGALSSVKRWVISRNPLGLLLDSLGLRALRARQPCIFMDSGSSQVMYLLRGGHELFRGPLQRQAGEMAAKWLGLDDF